MTQPAPMSNLALGNFQVSYLPDGGGIVDPLALYPASSPEAWEQYADLLDDEGKFITTIGAFLIQTGDRNIAVDLGIGPVTLDFPGFGPFSGGKYRENFAKTGLSPEQVTDVIFTHLHVDHCGWTTIEQNGHRELIYPNARYFVSQTEWEFWYGGDNPAGPDPETVQKPLAERIEMLAIGEPFMPGLTVLATPGHTPGHVSLLLEGDQDRLYLLGDVLHGPMQLTEPDWNVAFDADPEQARQTREQLYPELVKPHTLVVANHFANKVFGRIVQKEGRLGWGGVKIMADDALLTYLHTEDLAPPLPPDQAEPLVAALEALSDVAVYPRSLTAIDHTLFFMGWQDDVKYLAALTPRSSLLDGLTGQPRPLEWAGTDLTLLLARLTPANAAWLRQRIPFLQPQVLGLKKSVGCGDRLGLATPGHIRAVRGTGLAPVLAQQSMRENARTGRTPQIVIDEAMWGVLQEGWRAGFGADADHLKSTTDIDLCAAAGYTFFTIDPGEHVDEVAAEADPETVRQIAGRLPWLVLDTSQADLVERLADQPVDLGQFELTPERPQLLRAAAKYGRAVAYIVVMYRHLVEVMGDRPFELEISVDETESPTSLVEHFYLATELKRLGVEWVSFAPRYVGRFEKGVDYQGDLAAFEKSFAGHVALARRLGPYKLSLHSGSDKFSLYPVAAKQAGELIHLKTAGTSYLEALRAIAHLRPDLFREIVALAQEKYPSDRATYHVSAELERMPDPFNLLDEQLIDLLDDFHARQILHVTYGSILAHEPFQEPFFATLRANEETHYKILQRHFDRHLRPFAV